MAGNVGKADLVRRELVALTLAIGLAAAVTLLTAGVLYDAITGDGPGLTDNATQLLETAFAGIIGIVGAYLGFRAGQDSHPDDDEPLS
jgi:shikimate kinase